jgi:hypothetical protein
LRRSPACVSCVCGRDYLAGKVQLLGDEGVGPPPFHQHEEGISGLNANI